jgi:hypothetical protein
MANFPMKERESSCCMPLQNVIKCDRHVVCFVQWEMFGEMNEIFCVLISWCFHFHVSFWLRSCTRFILLEQILMKPDIKFVITFYFMTLLKHADQ